MSQPLAVYSFLPWLRHGLATKITGSGPQRPKIQVDLQLTGEAVSGAAPAPVPVSREIELYGPGDIIGIDTRMIIRTEPRNWITNFEPNYLAHIEFYDEDFPWRYTPAPPNGVQLTPWLTLIVLAEGEFEEGQGLPGKPLPFIQVGQLDLFPPGNELWAWSHVHVNRSLAASEAEFVSNNMVDVLPRFQNVLNQNPDLAYSRIVCPRQLSPNVAYHAFLIPTFETGRLAGLGLAPSKSPTATAIAWDNYATRNQNEGNHFPIYFRWYFRTGGPGDFEQLVRLLEPKTVNPKVGTRDMDVQKPGSNLPGINDPNAQGILKLGGALRAPGTPHYDDWEASYPDNFQQALAAFISLADDYDAQEADEANAGSGMGTDVQNDPDPLITAPLYGRWHALVQRLLLDCNGNPIIPNDNWVHELNLDPRYRVPAGFGTKVVQKNQEDYMKAAWDQIGAVLEANRRIRAAQLAREIAGVWFQRHLKPLHNQRLEKAFAVTGPVHRRLIAQGVTIHHQESISPLSTVPNSAVWRRLIRPRGRLIKSLPYVEDIQPDNLLTRWNQQRVFAVPPKVVGSGLLNVDQIGSRDARLSLALEKNQTPNVIASLPKFADFVLSEPNLDSRPPRQQGEDSRDGKPFKAALTDISILIRNSNATSREPPNIPIDLTKAADVVLQGIDPDATIPKRALQTIHLPIHIRFPLGERFQEAMAYPRIDTPMYEPLIALSKELFLPNLNLIEQNSITLLETNQKFIESYMVGLNHEFARELLWREYPTDQRGSYFRQFWNVSSFFNTDNINEEELREKLYDIPPLHLWSRFSKLGEHDHRELPGDSEEEVVLVIRGELLKRYPTAVIYAHKADWQKKPDGSIDPQKERVLVDILPTEEAKPPRSKIRTPLYEAKIPPDIYFFGFDLTAPVAKGGTGANPTDDAGWFFVIKERPGEPRFGLDSERKGSIQTFNDLAWTDATVHPNGHLRATSFSAVVLAALGPGDVEKTDQRNNDLLVNPAPASSARFAYVLYQAPVMVAVHAAEMLRTL